MTTRRADHAHATSRARLVGAVWIGFVLSCAPPPGEPLPIRSTTAAPPLPVREAEAPTALDSRFARPTHRQYRRAVADLLLLPFDEVADVRLREESAAGGSLFE